MRVGRRFPLLMIVLSCFRIGPARMAYAQAQTNSYPSHLPYSFSNFVWWTDSDLRAELKKRIPGLTDEVPTTGQTEERVRNALTALLRAKGIRADVLSEEPSLSSLRPMAPGALLGVDSVDGPPIPKPSIVFMITRPQVAIGTIKVESADDDARATVEEEFHKDEGKTFTNPNMVFSQYLAEESLRRSGYLSAQVKIRHGSPYKQGERYVVDETVTVNAGPVYRIDTIIADGGPLLEGRDLSRFFFAHSGDRATRSPFAQLGPELHAYYEQYGYADVHVVVNPTVDREHATVSYVLSVQPGPLYHLRSLKIEKLSPEQERRVREIFQMKPGDLYREAAITNLYRQIATEPLLHGYTLVFSPKVNKAAAAVDLTLDFSKEGGTSSVTIQ